MASNTNRIISWEYHLNSKFLGQPYVQVKNQVDFEDPPSNFSYVKNNVSSTVQTTLNEGDDIPFFSCHCIDCNSPLSTCCSTLSDHQKAYDGSGLLTLEPGNAIFECNKLCSCNISQKCSNRVVQRGWKTPVEVFRTSNSTGWGLKTLAPLKRGQFLMEYVGELIWLEEMNSREKLNTYSKLTYLFSLDFDDSKSPYVIDSMHYGNLARFINHSCDPNLEAYPVYINQSDLKIPKIALFACKDVPKKQELTIDYKMKFNSPKSKRNGKQQRDRTNPIPCKCGTDKCRKFI